MNSIQSVSVDQTDKEIKDIEDKMTELETTMSDNQERYYARFTAMEQPFHR